MNRSTPAASGSEGARPSRVELRILGGTDLRGPDGDARLREIVRQPKRLALLVYLAVSTPPGRHRRDHLVGLLWSRMEPERARAALRRALYFLRQRLGNGVLVGKGADRVGTDRSRLWCDATALERRVAAGRLADALELYRGKLLPGLRVEEAHGFERWLDRRRRELREAASGAAVSLAARARNSADPAEEATLLGRAVDIWPEREPVLRDLLRALVRSGEPGRALETYRYWQRRRKLEHGLPPSSETRELMDRIRSGVGLAATESDTETGGHRNLAGKARTGGRDAPGIVSPRRIVAREIATRARELAERGPSRNRVARELADEAIRLDGESAAAHAARAEARAQAVQLYGAHRKILGDALDDVHRALALAPHLPEAHFSHGLVHETAGRLRAATGPFRRAAELSENEPEFAGHLGRVLMLRGAMNRSLDWTRRQAERGSPAPHILLQMGLDLWCLGFDDEAADLYQQARDEREDLVWLGASWSFFELTRGRFDQARDRAGEMLDRHPESFAGRFAAGDAALCARDYEKALRHYDHCYRLDPESRHTGTHRSSRLAVGFARLQLGERDVGTALIRAAERESRRLLEGGADYGGLWSDLAAARAALGWNRRALDALEQGARKGWRQPGHLRHDPIFEPLRRDDRFQAILAFMDEDIREQRKTVE